jgi:ATP-binding cassette subfamily F protein 3
MEAEADYDMVRSCRNILGAFLFSGEEVEKKISVLSGGERARVCLAHLLLKPSNLLILDEPTNHLDLISKDVLKQAIETYQGTVIIISHDRDFLDGLVDKVIEFKDHGVKEHACSMNEFFEIRKLEDFRALEQEKKNAVIAQTAKPAGMSQEERKEQEKVRKQLKNKIDQLEKEVSLLETDIQAITKEIAANPTDIKLAQKYTILEKDLEKAMEHWEIEQNNWEALG